VATGHYNKADGFLATVPRGSEFMVPAFFWSLKSALLRGDSSLVSRCSERLMTSMSMNDLMKWVEVIRRSPIFKDTILLPSSDAKLLSAVEERAQNFSEFQRDRDKIQ
jgi:hypothetical protein